MEYLERAAREMMVKDGHIDHRQVTILVEGDTIILTGTVSTFYQKSLAQSFFMRVAAEKNLSCRIENALRVCYQ